MLSKIKILSVILFILLVFALALPNLIKSSNLISAGDNNLYQGKYQEALLFYNEAKDNFPVYPGLQTKIDSTKLLLESSIQYSQIEEVYAEIQSAPAVTEPELHRALNPGEIFVPILMYHHIRDNPRPYDAVWAALNLNSTTLENQMLYLINNNYHVVSLDDLEQALMGNLKLPNNPVVLTFDDGYENFYTNAYPILKKYNLKATIFVITRVVGQNSAYLTWPQIIEMDKSGLITIGSHTQHHGNLPDLSNSLIQTEITGARDDIKNQIGHAPKWFAYPYGSYNNFAINAVRTAGYNGAVSTIYSSIQSKERLFLLPRIMVNGKYSLDEFAKRLQK